MRDEHLTEDEEDLIADALFSDSDDHIGINENQDWEKEQPFFAWNCLSI